MLLFLPCSFPERIIPQEDFCLLETFWFLFSKRDPKLAKRRILEACQCWRSGVQACKKLSPSPTRHSLSHYHIINLFSSRCLKACVKNERFCLTVLTLYERKTVTLCISSRGPWEQTRSPFSEQVTLMRTLVRPIIGPLTSFSSQKWAENLQPTLPITSTRRC